MSTNTSYPAQFRSMTFEEAQRHADELNGQVATTSAALKVFPKDPLGLTPDAVRATVEYQTANRAHHLAFKKLRDFNDFFTSKFARELREVRANRRKEAWDKINAEIVK